MRALRVITWIGTAFSGSSSSLGWIIWHKQANNKWREVYVEAFLLLVIACCLLGSLSGELAEIPTLFADSCVGRQWWREFWIPSLVPGWRNKLFVLGKRDKTHTEERRGVKRGVETSESKDGGGKERRTRKKMDLGAFSKMLFAFAAVSWWRRPSYRCSTTLTHSIQYVLRMLGTYWVLRRSGWTHARWVIRDNNFINALIVLSLMFYWIASSGAYVIVRGCLTGLPWDLNLLVVLWC